MGTTAERGTMHAERAGVALLVVLTVLLGSTPARPAGEAYAGLVSNLVLNELHADPDTGAGDANGDGTVQSGGDEFVEIVNRGAAGLDLSGWTLADTVSTRHVFPPGSVVPAGCAVVVFGGGSPTGTFGGALVQTASSGTLGLNNGGDAVSLDDGAGGVVSYAYGAEGGDDQSLTRDPDVDGAEPLVGHTTATASGGTRFSPGTRVDGTAFAGCGAGPVATATSTATPVPTGTPMLTPPAVATSTPTATLAPTPTATITATPSVTSTPGTTMTPTATATMTTPPSVTPTAVVTATPVATVTASGTVTPAPSVTATASATATATATSTVAPTTTVTLTPGVTVTPTGTVGASPVATATPALPEPCAPFPRPACRVSTRPGRAVLSVKDRVLAARDRLDWKWRKGQATSVADFGDPLADGDLALCLYDESAPTPVLILAVVAPANAGCSAAAGECWVQGRAGARVLRYKNVAGEPDGLTRAVLKPGSDGTARITVKARGEHLKLPPLPLPLPLRVQFQAAPGPCWEAVYTAAGARRNDDEIFRGAAE
jgi:hypothetical protein